LAPDWCSRLFTEIPSHNFLGFSNAGNTLLAHLKSESQKFQIVVDSDLDGITSAAILYKFLQKFYPEIETVYSLHTGKQHGLSDDIKIEDGVTLVLCPDSSTNDVKQCEALHNRGIDVICLDHHIIEQPNPYAAVVNCMDGVYPNTHLCGAAVTWLFLWGFCHNCISFLDEPQSYLLSLLDLVAIATVSDIMEVTNEDNMYFIQNGLSNIQSKALRSFLLSNEVSLNDVTIEDIKFKVSPLISAMIRMGNMPEKTLLFRAFIDDYEEFDYEKRGSFDVVKENIYDRVVRLCKNAKSRQDRAKQKLLDECQVYEYPHILLVEYQADKSSTLTGLVANELANKYCKPCFVYRTTDERDENGEAWFHGSVRNYDGSPIQSVKQLLTDIFHNDGDFRGHNNAFGASVLATQLGSNAGFYAEIIEEYINNHSVSSGTVAVGDKTYSLDFSIPADALDAGFIQKLHWFERYSGYGFAPVTALVTGIKVCQENFKTMGKNSFNWKISDDDTGVSFVKFKIDKDTDELIQKFDDVDLGATTYFDTGYVIDAICTFGLNVYNGEIHPQAIIKDYMVQDSFKKESFYDDDDDFDLDFDL
jgi:single-stranded-DNA-specific exonuclease